MNISTGSLDFDQFLGNGYHADLLTGIYGEAGTGKTTLAMLAAVDQAKKGKKVFFIDTETGFSIERMLQICDDKMLFHKILVIKVKSFDEQSLYIEHLKELKDWKDIGLIIVDSLSSFYRVEAKQNLLNNQMANQLKLLSYIAQEHHIPVLTTHQVYTDLDTQERKMVGGNMVHNWCKVLIHLEKGKTRKAYLVKPEQRTFHFVIVDTGIKAV